MSTMSTLTERAKNHFNIKEARLSVGHVKWVEDVVLIGSIYVIDGKVPCDCNEICEYSL
jgi:hypothetical protein